MLSVFRKDRFVPRDKPDDAPPPRPDKSKAPTGEPHIPAPTVAEATLPSECPICFALTRNTEQHLIWHGKSATPGQGSVKN